MPAVKPLCATQSYSVAQGKLSCITAGIMEPDDGPPRPRDLEVGMHNLLGVPGPEILRSEEDAMWNTLRTLPGGGGVQAIVYRISRLIELCHGQGYI